MDSINNFLNIHHPIWQGLILAMLLGLTFYFCWSPVNQIISWLRLQKLIKRTGWMQLENVYLPDGMDGNLYIEHLILQDDSILVLSIKPYRGNIFAAEKIEQWTQVVSNHSYKFPNPLFQLEADLQCLHGAFPKTDFKGLVVFTGSCTFPKGKPEGVYDFRQLSEFAGTQNKNKPTEELQKIWLSINEQSEKATKMKPSMIYSRRDKKRLFYGSICFALSVCYFTWVMGWLQGVY